MTAYIPKQLSFDNPLCVVGGGAMTAVGLDAESTAAAVRASIDGFEEHPFMINSEGEPYILASVPSINAETKGCQRYIDLIRPVIEEALAPIHKSKLNVEVVVIVALPEMRPGVPAELAQEIQRLFYLYGTDSLTIKDVRTAHNGHAVGLTAYESAAKLIAGGKSDFCLVGGVDSYIDADTLDWIEDNNQLHTPSNAWGFVPGEAAAFSLVCSPQTASKYNLPIKAYIVGSGSTHEQNRIKTETVCIGEGLTSAVRAVVDKLPENTRIDFTICDQNGEAYRADEFGFMLCRVGEHFIEPSDYLAPADCWGDVGAASGVLFVNLAVMAAEKNYAKGRLTLLWASSEGGDRAALLVYAKNETMKITQEQVA